MNPHHEARRPGLSGCRGLLVIILAGIVGLLAACGRDPAVSGEGLLIERRPDLAYEQLFPYYVELCVTSQYRSKYKGLGGPAGHALMYVKGACKDDNAPFPYLRRCRAVATTVDDPEHGVGVSVNRWLRNVNWLAIPGYELFYQGNLAPDERLTEAHFDETVRDAIDKGVFDGVELHEYPTEAGRRSVEDFAAYQSIGTDFALRYARTSFCSRMPVTEPMLDEITAFLNDKNREYATGEADYHWNGVSDNCVHTVRNALAAANVWSPITARAVRGARLFNLAVLGAEGPIEDYRQVYWNPAMRDALHDFRWLPTRHGALLKTLPVHQPNDLFDATFRLFVLQSPFRQRKRQAAIRLLSDERFVDLGANLLHFRDKYDAILTQRYGQFDGLTSVRGAPYRRVERLHHDYLRAQRAEVDAMLDRLEALGE